MLLPVLAGYLRWVSHADTRANGVAESLFLYGLFCLGALGLETWFGWDPLYPYAGRLLYWRTLLLIVDPVIISRFVLLDSHRPPMLLLAYLYPLFLASELCERRARWLLAGVVAVSVVLVELAKSGSILAAIGNAGPAIALLWAIGLWAGRHSDDAAALFTYAQGSDRGISVVGTDFRLRFLNARQRSWFPDAAVGELCYVAYNRSPADAGTCPWCPVVRAMRSGKAEESITRSPDALGELRYYRVHATPVFDRGGSLLYVVETVEDISAQEVLEALRSRMDREVTAEGAVHAGLAAIRGVTRAAFGLLAAPVPEGDALALLDQTEGPPYGSSARAPESAAELIGALHSSGHLKPGQEVTCTSLRDTGPLADWLRRHGCVQLVVITRWEEAGGLVGAFAWCDKPTAPSDQELDTCRRCLGIVNAARLRTMGLERLLRDRETIVQGTTRTETARETMATVRDALEIASVWHGAKLCKSASQVMKELDAAPHHALPQPLGGAIRALVEEVRKLDGEITARHARLMSRSELGTSVNDAIKEALEKEQAERPADHCVIAAELVTEPSAEECLVAIPKLELVNIFRHIIQNAQEAMPDGGTLRIVLSRQTTEGRETVLVRFEDTGIGITSDVLPFVFGVGFSTKEHGSGIGLAYSKRVIEACGGRLDVHSRPGFGTTVVVTIPPLKEEEDARSSSAA